MNLSIKNILYSVLLVLVSGAVIGYLSWSGYSDVVAINNNQIDVLEDQRDFLNDLAIKKAEERKVKEEEEAIATAEEEALSKGVPEKISVPDTTNSEETSDTGTSTEPATEPNEEAGVGIQYFWDPDCGACMISTPIMQEIEGEGIVPVLWYNIDETPSYIGEYGIVQTPTYIVNGHKSHYPEEYPFTKEEIYDYWNTYK